ncbi:MAG: tetratricopeptide repeat protein [Planctomycetes bacterium]|nr:tetratricopeptide repeat protein [Planctomycetota bacterium]
MSGAPQRKDRARELFDMALEHPAAERAAFLAQKCAGDVELRCELEVLLKFHDEAQTALRDPASLVTEQPGDRIGRFKLLQRIGEGGFGTVWMAEQEEPVRRKVALKVLKAGMDTAQVVARFEAERQALALMDHPNIAKVFDGGATPQGRPYFVMELVRGVPITQYCDEASLTPRERLELFLPICQAVQHAHYKGVIHRDIKPSNVLVTLHDGLPVPKVIDFGIAKATQGRLTDRTMFTEFRQMLGTPEYMAPEQAELSGLDVDTRADVYSLGVLLYELLTGTRPFDFKTLLQAGYAEMLRTIKEVEPQKPSTRISTMGALLSGVAKHRRMHPRALGPLMRGDLDWIVMKSLEKDRNRRYATPATLAEDVQRHLRSEPVLAGPPSRLYKLRKYVRRHRTGVAAGGAIALALLAGGAAAVWGWRRASDESRTARTEAAKAEAMVALLEQMLASADPAAQRGPNYTVRELLEDFDRETLRRLDGEPEVKLALEHTIARSYLGLRLADKALPHVEAARRLAAELFGAESAATDESEALYGHYLQDCGRYQEAGAHFTALLARSKGRVPVEVSDDWRLSLAESARVGGQYDDAIGWLRELAAEQKQRAGDQRGAIAKTQRFLGVALSNRNNPGDFQESEQLARSVLGTLRELLPSESPEITSALTSLSRVLADSGRVEEALTLAEEVLARDLAHFGPEHVMVAKSKIDLAELQRASGQAPKAEPLLREAVESYRRIGTDPVQLAWALNQLGSVYYSQAKAAPAAEAWRESLEIRRRELGDHDSVARTMQNLALAISSTNPQESLALMEESLAMRIRIHGQTHAEVAMAQNGLASVLLARGDLERAELLVRSALETRRQLLPPGDFHTFQSQVTLGNCLVRQHRLNEALEVLASALASGRETLRAGHPELAPVLVWIAQSRWQQGELEAAVTACSEAVAIWRAEFGPTQPMAMNSAQVLVRLLVDAGKDIEARRWADQVFADMSTSMAAGDVRLAGAWVLRARAHRLAGEPEDAERALGEALALCANSSVRELGLATAQSVCAAYLLELERAAEAEPLLRKSLDLCVTIAPENQQRWTVASQLGSALVQLGQLAEAEPLLFEAMGKLPRGMPLPAGKVQTETCQRLIELYTRSGKAAEAEVWRAKLDELGPR